MKKTAVPTKASELEEAIADPAKLAAYFQDGKPKPEFGQMLKNYAKASAKKETRDAKRQIRDEAAAIARQMLKDGGYSKETAEQKLKKIHSPVDMTGGNAKSLLRKPTSKGVQAAKQIDAVFGHSADFFQAIWAKADNLPNGAELARMRAEALRITNSFGSIIPGDGGFLIPETLRAEILRIQLEQSLVRPRARVIPMDSLRVPIPTIDDVSHVSSVYGGVTAYWTEEAADLTESSASFGRVVLDAKKLTGYAEIPNELLADAVAFSGFFDQIFPEALNFFADVAFFTGTGDNEPTGFIGNKAVAKVDKETNQPAKSIAWQNLVKMYARMLPTSLQRCVWIANIEAFPELATMALSVGTGGGPVWIGNMSGGQGGMDTPPASILGRPLLLTEKASALGTQGDIVLVDLGYYLIGDRQMMQASQSPHYKFASDKTAFRLVERLDGRPWLQSAITPHKGSATLSAFVELATRS
jgi:HK97 family phage major capsid protein